MTIPVHDSRTIGVFRTAVLENTWSLERHQRDFPRLIGQGEFDGGRVRPWTRYHSVRPAGHYPGQRDTNSQWATLPRFIRRDMARQVLNAKHANPLFTFGMWGAIKGTMPDSLWVGPKYDDDGRIIPIQDAPNTIDNPAVNRWDRLTQWHGTIDPASVCVDEWIFDHGDLVRESWQWANFCAAHGIRTMHETWTVENGTWPAWPAARMTQRYTKTLVVLEYGIDAPGPDFPEIVCYIADRSRQGEPAPTVEVCKELLLRGYVLAPNHDCDEIVIEALQQANLPVG